MDKRQQQGMFYIWFKTFMRLLTRRLDSENARELGVPKPTARQSVYIRHLDCGSCNGCELELNALENPVYDMERFGIKFESSPRHADLLVLTGPFTRNLEEAALLTVEAMPGPKRILTVGDCAKDGGIFKDSYAVAAKPRQIEEAIVGEVPGCPPTPGQILKVLLNCQTEL